MVTPRETWGNITFSEPQTTTTTTSMGSSYLVRPVDTPREMFPHLSKFPSPTAFSTKFMYNCTFMYMFVLLGHKKKARSLIFFPTTDPHLRAWSTARKEPLWFHLFFVNISQVQYLSTKALLQLVVPSTGQLGLMEPGSV